MEEDYIQNQEDEDRKEQYLHFPEIGLVMKKSSFFSIEKDIEVSEGSLKSDIQYVIMINKDHKPRKIFYNNSELRDKRFNQILKELEEINIKVNTL